MPAPRNPRYEENVRAIMDRAVFVGDVGIRLTHVEPGRCETELAVLPRHAQQNGYVHAGVLATMADHTAGAAAGSLVQQDQGLLSVEFKINFLRPAKGPRVRCVSTVLKDGKTLSIVESELWMRANAEEAEALVAKATVTLAVVPWRGLPA